MPLLRGGVRATKYRQGIGRSASPLTRAARCRCRVRTPMPLRGACGRPSTGKASVGLHHPLRGRQGAAAGYARQCPSGGRAGSQYRQGIGRSASPFARRTNKAAMPFTRHTTSAGGKVPPPGAHANAPPGGVQAASTGKASGGLQHHLRNAQIRPQHHLRGAQIRPQYHLRGAQQARAARCRRRVRTPMPLRGACGRQAQARHRAVCRTTYTAHK